MGTEFVLFCYVATTLSIAQKSVCNHTPALHSVMRYHKYMPDAVQTSE